jgi:hypothetical protein
LSRYAFVFLRVMLCCLSVKTLIARIPYRTLGVLPLIFFLGQVIHYWRINELGHMLWMCNVGSLVLALGLFLDKPVLIRLSATWMIPGLIIWFVYVVLPWGMFLTSALDHIGGLVVSLIALKRYRMDRISWRYAFGWYLVVQLAARFVAPVAFNVNMAHAIPFGWERTFGSYWSFWLVLTAVTAAALWISGMILWSIYRPCTTEELIAHQV